MSLNPNPPSLEKEIAGLKRQLEEKDAEIKDLKDKVETLTKERDNFKKMYFEAAKLGERVIPPESLQEN